MRFLRAVPFLPLLGLFLFLAACNDSPTDPVRAASVEVEGPTTMTAGQTAQAEVTVMDEDGNLLLDHPVEWESSNPAVATVDEVGFIISLEAGTTTITAAANGVSDSFELEVEPDPCTVLVGELVPGDTVEGELTEASCLIEGWFHDPWLLEMESSTTVQIDLSSEEFNPFLILTDSDVNEIAMDEDSGEGDDARISLELPAGFYFIWASTVGEQEVGEYQLSVIEVDAAATTAPGKSAGRLAPRVPLPNIPAPLGRDPW